MPDPKDDIDSPVPDLEDDIEPLGIGSDPADELDMVIDESDPLIDQSSLSEQDQEALLGYSDSEGLEPEELDSALVDYSYDALEDDL